MGAFQCLKWLWKKRIVIEYNSIRYSVIQASSKGYIHILKWLRDHQLLPLVLYSNVMESAVVNKQVDILKWLGKTSIQNLGREIINHLIIGAASNLSISVLSLFHEWQLIDDNLFYYDHQYREYECDTYPVIDWLRKHHYLISYPDMLHIAIDRNEWHIVDLIQQVYPDLALFSVDVSRENDVSREKLNRYQAYRQRLKN